MLPGVLTRCACCGAMVNLSHGKDCLNCLYPVHPEKEQQFLESSLRELRRVMRYSAPSLTVVELVQHYEGRLHVLLQPAEVAAQPVTPVIPEVTAARPLAVSVPPASQPPRLVQRTAEPPAPPAASMRGFSFSSDAVINIIATLGGFLVLAGALDFVLTTTSLWWSFAVIFLVHAIFGSAGLIARRFPTLQVVSRLYTIIFALLVPLVSFSAYRLVTNNLIELSAPALLTLAALYAAVVYMLLAMAQRFSPFAYLGAIALFVSNIAFTQNLQLPYYWWPCTAMLLVFPLLLTLTPVSGRGEIFTESMHILRTPLRVLLWVLVGSIALVFLSALLTSLISDLARVPDEELRVALLCSAGLFCVWTALALWRTGRNSWVPLLAYEMVGVFLLLGYTLSLDLTGYALLLTGTALFYHILARLARTRGLSALALDQLTLGLTALVLFLLASAVPFQLLFQVYAGSSFWFGAAMLAHAPAFVPHGSAVWNLLTLCMCGLLTLDIALNRAGRSRVPAQRGWCWLLLLGGTQLSAAYGMVILFQGWSPLVAFLLLTVGLLLGAVLVRRVVGSAWSQPLDLLTLWNLGFCLAMSLTISHKRSSALLLGFAVLLYLVLCYQRRPWLSFLPALLTMLALPALQTSEPASVFVLALVLPLTAVSAERLPWREHVRFAGMFSWSLLIPALFYGLTTINGVQEIAISIGLHVTPFSILVSLGVVWYIAALLARRQLWLIPAVLFWLAALWLPTNNFWALCVLTVILTLVGVGLELRNRSGRWSWPFYITAFFCTCMVVYTSLTQQHLAQINLVLLGLALLSALSALLTGHRTGLWLMSILTICSTAIATGIQLNPYQAPISAIVAVLLGVTLSRSTLPALTALRQKPVLARGFFPFYAIALGAAVLTGFDCLSGNINRPFYGGETVSMLIYPLLFLGIASLEHRSRWNCLVAAFAIWSIVLMHQLTPLSILSVGSGLALFGLLIGRVSRLRTRTTESANNHGLHRFVWNWPWYTASLVAALDVGIELHPLIVTGPALIALLMFTLLAVSIMFIEHAPELLVVPAALATWTLSIWLPASNVPAHIVAYALLCVLIFASQFIWRLIPSTTRWLTASTLHNILSLGGLSIVVLSAVGQGGVENSGLVAHTGALALLMLSVLLGFFGWLRPGEVEQMVVGELDERKCQEKRREARMLRHDCAYVAGFLLALVVSWELFALNLVRVDFEVVTLVPASYLIVIAPFLLRERSYPAYYHAPGQGVALLGSALLLLPALWFSFNGSELLPTVILLTEALLLLAVGLVTRVRIFILCSAALIIVGTLRVLFLSIPPSVPLLMMAFGGLLILLATALVLSRHRLQTAWQHWE